MTMKFSLYSIRSVLKFLQNRFSILFYSRIVFDYLIHTFDFASDSTLMLIYIFQRHNKVSNIVLIQKMKLNEKKQKNHQNRIQSCIYRRQKKMMGKKERYEGISRWNCARPRYLNVLKRKVFKTIKKIKIMWFVIVKEYCRENKKKSDFLFLISFITLSTLRYFLLLKRFLGAMFNLWLR